MAHYLIQVAYTPEAWATMSKNPQNRRELVEPAVQSLGGRIEAFYFAFGEYDVVVIGDFPSNVDAASFSVGVSAGGAVKSIKTTPLMTTDEGLEIMRKSGSTGYAPPG